MPCVYKMPWLEHAYKLKGDHAGGGGGGEDVARDHTREGELVGLLLLGMMAFIKLEDRSNLKGEQPGTQLFRRLRKY